MSNNSSFFTLIVHLNNNTNIGAAAETTSSTFSLSKAVCNHGFFMLPPNLWIPSLQMLQRPIRLLNGSSYIISIFQPHQLQFSCLYIRVHDVSKLCPDDQNEIISQVRRMLRISPQDENDVRAFQKMHPSGRQGGFGRIFRSPSLFEDVVKSILLCSCGWKRSMEMAGALCRLESELRPQYVTHNNFPSIEQLGCLDAATLNKFCNLGYRAKYVISFAKAVSEGNFNLNRLEEMAASAHKEGGSYSQVEMQLKRIAGAGDFVIANISMCLGFYHRVPIDSETKRHLRQVHGKEVGRKKKCIEKDVEQIYGKYAPYQCLAYWFELIEGYEEALGSTLSKLPTSKYTLVAGNCSSNE